MNISLKFDESGKAMFPYLNMTAQGVYEAWDALPSTIKNMVKYVGISGVRTDPLTSADQVEVEIKLKIQSGFNQNVDNLPQIEEVACCSKMYFTKFDMKRKYVDEVSRSFKEKLHRMLAIEVGRLDNSMATLKHELGVLRPTL